MPFTRESVRRFLAQQETQDQLIRTERVTAPVTVDPWSYVILPSDFTTNSSTPSAVSGLSFMPAVNSRYEFEATLFLRTSSVLTGPRSGVLWPSPSPTDGVVFIRQTSALSTTVLQNGNILGAILAPAGLLPNTTGSWPANVQGAFFTGGTTPTQGLRIQFASDLIGVTVTIKAGSFLKYRKY